MDEVRFWSMIEDAWRSSGGKVKARDKLAAGTLEEEKAAELQEAMDDDMVPATLSVREMVLRDVDGDNALISMRLWNNRMVDGACECAAARLELANGQQLFIDGSYHFGFRIGGAEQELIWSENWRETDRSYVDLAPER